MKLSDLKRGDSVVLDDGFTCHPGGVAAVHQDDVGFFFFCSDGKHYFDGQATFSGELTGVTPIGDTLGVTRKCVCGKSEVQFGEGLGLNYKIPLESVPVEVAVKLHGTHASCPVCGKIYSCRIKSPQRVPVVLEETK